jgi:hypothetical protein
MNNFIKKIMISFIIASATTLPTCLHAVENNLDLHDTGKKTTVKLPFKYFEKKEGDKLTLIHQGGYAIFDMNPKSREVAVIGPCNPCIGLAITDGTKLIAFHKYSNNSMDHMIKIIKETLDWEKNDLFGQIYTCKNDNVWTSQRTEMHGNRTHTQAVKHLKDILCEQLNIKTRTNIVAQLYSSTYQDKFLGWYEHSELCFAVRMDSVFTIKGDKLNIFSIDPIKEDVMDVFQENFKAIEQYGPYIQQVINQKIVIGGTQITDPNTEINFKDFKNYLYSNFQNKDQATPYLRTVSQKRMQKEEDECYKKKFGKLFTDMGFSFGNEYNKHEFFEVKKKK